MADAYVTRDQFDEFVKRIEQALGYAEKARAQELALVNQRFELVEKRFEQVEKRFEQVDQRFSNRSISVSSKSISASHSLTGAWMTSGRKCGPTYKAFGTG